MNIPIHHIQPLIYTNPDGLQLGVQFILDLDKRGYINATAIAKQFGRVPKDWLKNDNVQAYINALIEKMNSSGYANSLKTLKWDNYPISNKSTSYNDLVFIAEGAPDSGGGTWLHPKLGIVFARWLSPHFAVWVDEQITTLLYQNPQQQSFPELSQIFAKLEEYQQQAPVNEQRLWEHINQRFGALEQYIEQRLDANEQILNRFHECSIQETRYNLGQLYKSIQKIEKILSQQQQGDLLQPSVEENFKKILLEYQQVLQTLLREQQDEFIVKIQEQIEQIIQSLPAQPEIVTAQPVDKEPLTAKIASLRTSGQSWNAIARELNAASLPTTSGKGKWYGSSVKKYLEKS